MKADHVDAQRLRAVLEGSATDAERGAVLRHLAGGCETCEATLASTYDDDVLSRLLVAQAAAPVAAPPMRPATWVATAPPASARPGGWNARRRLLAAGLLAAAGMVFSLLPVSPGRREKGDTGTPVVALQVVLAERRDGVLVADRILAEGESLSASQSLLFEVDVDRAARRSLFVVEADGDRVLLYPPGGSVAGGLEPAGPRRAGIGRQWVVLDLADQRGDISIVAGASPRDVTPADLMAAWPGAAEAGWATTRLRVVR